jgi:hypothetical protein
MLRLLSEAQLRDLSGNALKILLIITRKIGDNSAIALSFGDLCRAAKLAKHTTEAAAKELERSGLIAAQRSPRRVTRYALGEWAQSGAKSALAGAKTTLETAQSGAKSDTAIAQSGAKSALAGAKIAPDEAQSEAENGDRNAENDTKTPLKGGKTASKRAKNDAKTPSPRAIAQDNNIKIHEDEDKEKDKDLKKDYKDFLAYAKSQSRAFGIHSRGGYIAKLLKQYKSKDAYTIAAYEVWRTEKKEAENAAKRWKNRKIFAPFGNGEKLMYFVEFDGGTIKLKDDRGYATIKTQSLEDAIAWLYDHAQPSLDFGRENGEK